MKQAEERIQRVGGREGGRDGLGMGPESEIGKDRVVLMDTDRPLTAALIMLRPRVELCDRGYSEMTRSEGEERINKGAERAERASAVTVAAPTDDLNTHVHSNTHPRAHTHTHLHTQFGVKCMLSERKETHTTGQCAVYCKYFIHLICI